MPTAINTEGPVVLRKMGTLNVGVLGPVPMRRPRSESLAAMSRRMREEIYASYAAAAADPEFMRELEETHRAFDVTVGDGLEPEDFDD